jgi:hypothetical protein
MKPTDPDCINQADLEKLVAIYQRVCPNDQLADNDPWRPVIAAEMLDVGMAPTPEAALQVIAWWDSHPENLKPIVDDVRRSFKRMKLEGSYGAAA